MNKFDELKTQLITQKKTWLITGVAGFIGSNLLENLLKLNQKVVGLDNYSTGYQKNLNEVKINVTQEQWSNFTFIKGDICNLSDCKKAFREIDYVLHQAALGSVSRSIEDPIITNNNNICGFLNILISARDSKVKNFVYAASSSTYGDHTGLPKVENLIGKPLSTYALTKYVNELYAEVFSKNYGMKTIGLRYFNVFGPRQDSNGAYAAVIPKWINNIIKNEKIYINGDGETSRDFCHINNIVQANILAALSEEESTLDQVYNIAIGERISLNQLYLEIKKILEEKYDIKGITKPIYKEFRQGDVRHSLASIEKARRLLKYEPTEKIIRGLEISMPWYYNDLI